MQDKTTTKEAGKDQQLRQIGRGFIVGRENPFMGHRLTNAYVDEHEKMYVIVNNTLEPLGNYQRFLVVA